MEISLQHYRISIGTYSLSGALKLKKIKLLTRKSIDRSKVKNSWNFIKILLCTIFLSSLQLQFCPLVLPLNMQLEKISVLNSTSQVSHENILNPHLNWGLNLSINKLCHILYGNRRNFGYKYFSWNCDRGLLSKNKIEDVYSRDCGWPRRP